MTISKEKRNHILKIQYGKKDERYETSKRKAFVRHAGMIKWEKHPKVYLRVSYGMSVDNFGINKTFYNDGDYNNKKDFTLALKAFMEE